jgi:hypothetical protein
VIVTALEETEETAGVAVALDVSSIIDGGNTATYLDATIRQERLRAVALVERMSTEADHLFLIMTKWRNPVGIVTVEYPWELQERLALASRRDWLHDNIRHINPQ